MRFKTIIPFIFLCFFFEATPLWAQGSDGSYLILQDPIVLRVKKLGNTLSVNDKQGISTLPPGSVVWVPKSTYDPKNPKAPESLRYTNLGKASTAKFVGNIQIVSVPGFTPEQISELNSSVKDNPSKFYLSHSFLQKAEVSSKPQSSVFLSPITPTASTKSTTPAELCLPEDGFRKSLNDFRTLSDLLPQSEQNSIELPEDTSKVTAKIQDSKEKACSDNAKTLSEAEPKGKAKVSLEDLLKKHSDLPESSKEALKKAYEYYQNNLPVIKNRKFITVVDFTLPSSDQRLFTFDLETNELVKSKVSHGRSSGDLEKFNCYSNLDGSHATPPGFHLTGDIYDGKYGNSIRLLGLETQNALSCDRAVVIHRAKYISSGGTGRSQGCPAIPFDNTSENLINDKISNGSLFYHYTGDRPECKAKVENKKKSTSKKSKKKKKKKKN